MFSFVNSLLCWWKELIPRHLPLTEGPYYPGCVDLMTDYSPHGTFVRLYYPTSLSRNTEHYKKWFPWLPSKVYIDAFASVLKLWRYILRLAYFILARGAHVPAAWGEDVTNKIKKLPVIVLSHGLGGSRFLYSSMCTEFAAHGYLVAAIEHRDNSAGITYYYKSKEDFEKKMRTWINFKHISMGKSHYSCRNEQAHKRAEECKKLVDLLENINKGLVIENIVSKSFSLSQLEGRLDFTDLVMMGHSFGGATALLTSSFDSRFKIVVVLDGWMFPLKDETDLPMKINQPLIFINTQTFQIESNVNVMERFMNSSGKQNADRSAFTIRNTTHENQSDTPHLLGYWLNISLKKIDPVIATRINNHLILNFLQRHIRQTVDSGSDHYLAAQSHNIVPKLWIQ